MFDDYDPQLIDAIFEELGEKLNREMVMPNSWSIDIKLNRHKQYVSLTFDSEKMGMSRSRLPGEEDSTMRIYNFFDPNFDPVKVVCKFVDKSLKEISDYNKSVKESREILEMLL